jgi:hypothetical protein
MEEEKKITGKPACLYCTIYNNYAKDKKDID